MFFMAQILLMAGVFGLASSGEEIRSYSVGQHIGAALAVTMLAGWLLPLAISQEMMNAMPWVLRELTYGAAVWLSSWPLGKLIYGADNRQAVTIASYAAVGYLLIDAFMRWAVSY
jgi:hypothetical protein